MRVSLRAIVLRRRLTSSGRMDNINNAGLPLALP